MKHLQRVAMKRMKRCNETEVKIPKPRRISEVEGRIIERAFERCGGTIGENCGCCEYVEACQRLIDKLLDMQELGKGIQGMKRKEGAGG